MSAWEDIINGFDFRPLLEILMRAIPALICVTLHEISHGLVAYRLGDPTAKNAGRLTLNPIKHIDIFGFLMLVVAQQHADEGVLGDRPGTFGDAGGHIGRVRICAL